MLSSLAIARAFCGLTVLAFALWDAFVRPKARAVPHEQFLANLDIAYRYQLAPVLASKLKIVFGARGALDWAVQVISPLGSGGAVPTV